MESKTAPRKVPLTDGGHIDKDQVRAWYMASEYIDWTRFAEALQWDPHRSRLDYPVATWQEEKRRRLAETQGDLIRALVFERKFKWTKDIVATLDRYPRAIDNGLSLAEAKMSQLADMYRDYQDYQKNENHPLRKRRKVALRHPWEKLSLTEMSMFMKGIKDLTEAKLKALMLDKWAVSKFDVPSEELEPAEPKKGPILTVEGRGEASFDQLQRWFDHYHDKPTESESPQPIDPTSKNTSSSYQDVSAENHASNEVEKISPTPDQLADQFPEIKIIDDGS